MTDIILNDKQTQLFNFVKKQHGAQVRKYTNEPYWFHLLNVAAIVAKYEPDGIEIALCHDLFEDTECKIGDLYDFLIKTGYLERDAINISYGVGNLTDEYTKENFPNLNRRERKLKEAERLGSIISLCQTVKYADLIDNTSSIVQYDPSFAKVYLQEKKEILLKMRKGNPALLKRCEEVLEEALLKLEKQTV